VRWLPRVFGTRRLERELDAELRFHFDQQVADNMRAGMSEADARRHARLLFGGMDPTKEACRDARGTRWLLDIVRDLRAGVRSLGATPGFTVVATLVLTLGIGASTAIFSVVDAVVLRPLPFDESGRLVEVSEIDRDGRSHETSPQNYADWKGGVDVFDGLAAIADGGLDLKREGVLPPETLVGNSVTADFFSVIRVAPTKGRAFTKEDETEGRDAVALISYGLWQRRFGGAADVIGKRLHGRERSVEIVGVLPRGFDFPPDSVTAHDIWTPYVVPATQRDRARNDGRYWDLQLVGRLRHGATVEQAQARLDHVNAALASAYPKWFADSGGARVTPLRDSLTGDVTRKWMFLLLGAVSFVLLLSCVNVANLLLVRATSRRRELAVRAALGATRWDLARALLAESLVLSCVGAAFGVVLAGWGVDIIRDAMPAGVPRIEAVAVNVRVLVAAVVAAVGTGLLFGLVPAIPFSRPALNAALKDGGRAQTAGADRHRLRTALVVAEVALAVVLLVGSGLFLASFARVTRIDLGMNIDRVLTVQVSPPEDAPHNRARILSLLARVASIQGVDAASVAGTAIPMAGGRISWSVRVPGAPVDRVSVDKRDVSPDYFRVLQVPLVAGRFFTDADRQDAPGVAILNAAAAKRLFGDIPAAIRQQFQFGDRQVEVVGVVGDVRQFGPETTANAAFFVPYAQSTASWGTLALRTSGDVPGIRAAVNAAVWAEFPDAIIPEANTLREFWNDGIAVRRFNMLLLGLFGALGLVIAALGIYGVMSYVVTQRTQEIGIRMALGAEPAGILRSILRRTLAVVAAGLALGVFAAWMLSGMVEKFLFEVRPHDVRVYLVVCLVLIAAGVAAAVVPARRAARVDPLVALRME
jgi:predicted permease